MDGKRDKRMACEIQRVRHKKMDFGAQPLKGENICYMKLFQFEIMATTYHCKPFPFDFNLIPKFTLSHSQIKIHPIFYSFIFYPFCFSFHGWIFQCTVIYFLVLILEWGTSATSESRTFLKTLSLFIYLLQFRGGRIWT